MCLGRPLKALVLIRDQAKRGLAAEERVLMALLTCRGGGWCVGSVGTSPGLVEALPRPPGAPHILPLRLPGVHQSHQLQAVSGDR